MSSVVPPQPPPPPTPAQPAQPPVLTVTDPPEALGKLLIGARLEGLVLAAKAPATQAPATQGPATQATTLDDAAGLRPGVVQIKTSLGTLAVRPTVTLPNGASLSLTLITLSPQIQLRVISIDGQPPSAILKSAAKTIPAGSHAASRTNTTQTSQTTSPSVRLAIGSTITATLLRPPGIAVGGQAGIAGGGQAGIASGGQAISATTGQVTGGQTGIAGGGQAGGTSFAQTGGTIASTPPLNTPTNPTGHLAGRPDSGTNPAHAPRSGQTTGSNPVARGAVMQSSVSGSLSSATLQSGDGARFPAGTRVSVRIVSLTPTATNQQPATAMTGLATGNLISGTVTGTTHAGHPIISTAQGIFALATKAPLMTNSSVRIEVMEPPVRPAPGASGLLPLADSEVVSGREWPNLREVMSTLMKVNPAAASHLANVIIPKPNSAMTSTVLFFLSALRGGDVRSWLGNTATQALQRARPDLLNRLGEDFKALSHVSDDGAGQEWRVTMIPFHPGAQIEAIRLFMQKKETDKKKNAKKRFIIDMHLTRLGRVQLDGLFHDSEKQFDVIVRTQTHLPPAMKSDIYGIFDVALNTTGYHGGVAFQSSPPNFIEPVPAAADNDSLGLLI